MLVLGVNAFHGDSSAALVRDGELIAAVEEERFNRIKHWAGFPAESIRYVLEAGGATVSDLDHVAVSFNPKANLGRKALFALTQRPSVRSIIDRLQRQGKSLSLKQQLADVFNINVDRVSAELHNVEHHDAHIAHGFYLSPFKKSAILSIDGMGDFVSTVTALGEQTQVEKLDEVFYPHSLGFLYRALTIYLGFTRYGDEYKVMGLAPYGKPEFIEQFRKIIRPTGNTFELNLDYFTHATNGISETWEDGSPITQPFHSEAMEELLGPARCESEELTSRHENLAASLQAVTEEILFHVLKRLHERTRDDRVVIVGGCAMNSVANGKITSQTPFFDAYIPVGAADNGTSIGAAYHVWNKLLDNPRSFKLRHGYLGCDVDPVEVRTAASDLGIPGHELEQDELLDYVVDAICDGKVVGWFQGRMEFGARALGNRSLLADPRRTDMRDIINLKIKFREKFRPFAPSILAEYVGEYFDFDLPSPFMERVLPIRDDKRTLIPAVTHVDGTGRLQSVSKETAPLYWELINRFRERTGIPILLNTSLNENEPIVRTPKEAISCFLRTSMDMIVLGNFVIDRATPDFPEAAKEASRVS